MAQTSFAFDELPATAPIGRPRPAGAPDIADPSFQTGYGIGWDHARHGLVPPPRHLLPGHPVRQGWQAGRRAFARRTLAAHAGVHLWLGLRLEAWERNLAFEELLVTPRFLAQLITARCPVTRETLAAGQGRVVRLNQAAGFAAGNLVMVSERVARALDGRDLTATQAAAAQARAADDGLCQQLNAAEWDRLATLVSLATPLAPALAAAQPLHALPPNRVRVLNPVQGLQAWVTLQVELDGWSQRMNRFAALLPETARPTFRVFVGGLLPRVWQAGRPLEAQTLRERLEDAWSDERVLRRWQRFAQALSPADIDRLIDSAVTLGLSGRRLCGHAEAAATEGWALGSHGRADDTAAATPAQFRPMPCRKLSTASV